ncbi:hypothetical protein [Paracoccus mutanolyticus]|uniref:hypothetical protein n=1 Tax=Paracoccus mutanolyticus TaxID=1499308 RepID=UPI0011AEBBD2|nr:hypothetical protein [Paracoccus mutanolyticus]
MQARFMTRSRDESANADSDEHHISADRNCPREQPFALQLPLVRFCQFVSNRSKALRSAASSSFRPLRCLLEILQKDVSLFAKRPACEIQVTKLTIAAPRHAGDWHDDLVIHTVDTGLALIHKRPTRNWLQSGPAPK